jgi:hypothetical protein
MLTSSFFELSLHSDTHCLSELLVLPSTGLWIKQEWFYKLFCSEYARQPLFFDLSHLVAENLTTVSSVCCFVFRGKQKAAMGSTRITQSRTTWYFRAIAFMAIGLTNPLKNESND